MWFPHYCGVQLYPLPAIKFVVDAHFCTISQYCLAVVIRAILCEMSLFAAANAEAERLRASPMPPEDIAKLFILLLSAFAY